MRSAQILISIAAASFFALGPALADAKTRAECERDYKPEVGQAGKDVVWVPTPDELVSRMLTMAKVTAKDYVVDLGAGDGKIAIAAGRNFGATALGIEYNPDMAKLAQCFVQAEGIGNKVKIIQGDIFKEDFSKATVITMYLLPELNLRLRPTLLNMKPGTRVTSHQFTMSDWEADETAEIEYRSAYLWIVPAKVEGNWSFREQGGTMAFTVALNQKFQRISGDATAGQKKNPLVGATLRGEEIKFAFNDEKGQTRTLTGTVRGNEINGTLRGPAGVEIKVSGKRG
jgi:Methyltransferase domain